MHLLRALLENSHQLKLKNHISPICKHTIVTIHINSITMDMLTATTPTLGRTVAKSQELLSDAYSSWSHSFHAVLRQAADRGTMLCSEISIFTNIIKQILSTMLPQYPPQHKNWSLLVEMRPQMFLSPSQWSPLTATTDMDNQSTMPTSSSTPPPLASLMLRPPLTPHTSHMPHMATSNTISPWFSQLTSPTSMANNSD